MKKNKVINEKFCQKPREIYNEKLSNVSFSRKIFAEYTRNGGTQYFL